MASRTVVTTDVTWEKEWRFRAENPIGNSVVVDGPFTPGAPYESLKPGQMMLASLGACLGMDFVKDVLGQGRDLAGLTVRVAGTMDLDPPWAYSEIAVEFSIRSKDLDEAAARQAIRRAEFETCSVAATLRRGATITTAFNLESEP